jgi:8-amino-7-oxononanoate synthase
MKNLHQRLTSKLQQREKDGNLRVLKSYNGYTDFFSNDYLGFGNTTAVHNTAAKNPGSSRLIAGTTDEHLKLEAFCSDLFQNEKSILFNSGYVANLGVLSSIPQKDDIILYDERSHASIKDGVRLSLAKGIKFKHNDINDLSNKLDKHIQKTVFVIVESLYSMDGDLAPVDDIFSLCEKHGAYLIVDEAHSGGVYGENGSGYCPTKDIVPYLKIITFGKAFGAHCACVIGNTTTIDYLVNYSRPFIYTTALSPNNISFIQGQLTRADLEQQQSNLRSITTYFNNKFNNFTIKSDPSSPIKSIIYNDRTVLRTIEKHLHDEKIGVKAIYAPTVPRDKECLRISLHAYNTTQEVDQLYAILEKHEVD